MLTVGEASGLADAEQLNYAADQDRAIALMPLITLLYTWVFENQA